MPFELIKSETLLKGRAFAIRRDWLKTPDGREAKYDIIEHTGSAVIIPLDAEGNLLFVRQYRHAAGADLLELPAGTLDVGEEPAVCAAREMREETGLTPVRCKLLRVGERIRPPLYKDGTHHLVYLDFVVDRWTGDLQLDGEELTDGLWLLPQAALDLPLTFTTRQAIEFYLAHSADGACDYQPGQVD